MHPDEELAFMFSLVTTRIKWLITRVPTIMKFLETVFQTCKWFGFRWMWILENWLIQSYLSRHPPQVFSCRLGSEQETALSIIDPVNVQVELCGSPTYQSSSGLLDAFNVEDIPPLLEVRRLKGNTKCKHVTVEKWDQCRNWRIAIVYVIFLADPVSCSGHPTVL